MNGYHILGGAVPPYQVLQQQSAGLPPGSIPPWYAMQYPAGYVPPLLVSVDNPLEEDPFDASDLLLRHHDEREQRDLQRSHLLGGYHVLSGAEGDWNVIPLPGASEDVREVARLLNRIYAHRERDPGGGPDRLVPNVVTYQTAGDLVKVALPAIDKAKAIAPQGWFIPSKAQTMASTYNALVDHGKAIVAANAAGKTGAYPGAEKLRKDVLKAFVEVEGSIAGAAAAARLSYWSEVKDVLRAIGDAILAAAKAVNATVIDLLDDAKSTAKTIYWTIVALVAAAIGVVGWVLIRHGGTIASAAIPQVAAERLLRR